MLLSDIFDYLTFGELAHIKIGGTATGGILEADYPKIVTNINLGMIELHKRFNLKMKEIPLQLYDQITLYYLNSDYTESSGTQPIKYIVDGTLVDPFNDDILMITNVYNEIGTELPLNDLDTETSVFTPTPTTLQVPEANSENSLAIIYRAQPDKINYVGLDAAAAAILEVALPVQLLDCLTSFIAWKIFAPLNVGERAAEANNYYQKFEAAVQLVKSEGLLNEDMTTNKKFGENGWV